MNRRGKIIVSVVGIFIVLLALVGITYGYFLTRIQGNTNTTSISVTTKNLELVYGDGTQKIITKERIMPDTVIGTKDFTVTNKGADTSYVVIIDGDGDIDNGITPINVNYVTSGTTRNGTPYSAGQSTTFESNDFVYTLTCTSNLGEDCNEQNYETSLPMNGGIILGNNIKEGDIHTYNLTVTYKDNGDDQTDDMNKGFNAQVNIEDIKRINPYSDDKDSLAYNIINNSMLNKNGTELSATTLTNPAEEVSQSRYRSFISSDEIATYGASALTVSNQQFIINALTNGMEWAFTCFNSNYESNGNEGCYDVKLGFATCEEVKGKYIYNQSDGTPWYVEECTGDGMSVYSGFAGMDAEMLAGYGLSEILAIDKDESVLSATQDDYGTSFYYRGYIKDNYVNFAGMCWRIVRIDGLGNTKLILEDKYAECNDNIDNDGEGTNDYKYTGAWNIPASNGESLTIDTSTNEPFRTGNFGYNQIMYSVGYNRYLASYVEPKTNPERSMVNAFKYFQKTNLAGYTSKLTTGNWCYNDIAYSDEIGTNIIDKQSYYNSRTTFYYDSYVRLVGDGNIEKNPTLKCNGIVMNKYKDNTDMLVSALTADEIMYAGGIYGTSNQNYYLINNYQYDNSLSFWSLSPYYFHGSGDGAFSMYDYGDVDYYSVNSHSNSFRPAVSLESGVGIVAGGEGTKTNPYEIEA